jgi:hypothetical protein
MDALGDVVGTVLLIAFVAFVVTAAVLLLITPIAALVFTIADIFNREDIAAGKLVWTLVVLLVPLMGLAAYWLSKPSYESTPRALLPQRPVATSEGSQPATERQPAVPRQAA